MRCCLPIVALNLLRARGYDDDKYTNGCARGDATRFAWFIIGACACWYSRVLALNNPQTPHRRTTTTFGRYYLATAAYSLAWLFFYSTGGLSFLGKDTFLAFQKGDVGVSADKLAFPLYAALALTVFLTSFPLFKIFDDWLRQIAHTVARIPSYSEVLCRYLLEDQPSSNVHFDEKSAAPEEKDADALDKAKELLSVLGKRRSWGMRYFLFVNEQELIGLKEEQSQLEKDLAACIENKTQLESVSQSVARHRTAAAKFAVRAVLSLQKSPECV